MAIALRSSIGTVATGSGSVAPVFAQATAAGNLLIAWVASSANITSSTGGWTAFGVSGNKGIYFKPNCGASETAPTWTSAGATMFARLAEYTGALTTSPDDKSGINASIVSPNVISGGTADTASGSLVIGFGTAL